MACKRVRVQILSAPPPRIRSSTAVSRRPQHAASSPTRAWGTTSSSSITRAGTLSAEQVAGYIAKYATKATESFGSGLDRRLGPDDLEHLDRLPAHVAELVRAAWELVAAPDLDRLRLQSLGAHAGLPGSLVDQEPPLLHHLHHPAPGPVTFAKRRRAKDGIPAGCLGQTEDGDQVEVIAWTYVASGYTTEGERWLALSAAARTRTGGSPGRS